MRVHLGHHFYGAGNLGDDFMLAGFLRAMHALAPSTKFSCCVPFALPPLQRRFPTIEWLPYEEQARTNAIDTCDVWLGLGGSPFQSALSRWFLDHLMAEATSCKQAKKPMFFLGVGVQTAAELDDPDARQVCSSAAGIWTRDTLSAQRLRALPTPPPIVRAAGDLAHIFFRDSPPAAAQPRRVTTVVNFDYGAWPGQAACLSALRKLPADDHVWLAQESRDLPGAEHALFASLPESERSHWRLVSPEHPGSPLTEIIARWPSGEWLVTARYHAALAGAWAGSKIVVLGTNEKLASAARELQLPLLAPDADEDTVTHVLNSAQSTPPPRLLADRAYTACAELVRSAVAHQR